MARAYHTYKIKDSSIIKQQMLTWASRFSICCFLDNQEYDSKYHSYEVILGVGSLQTFEPSDDYFSSLDTFINTSNDWIFSHFNYEIRNEIEGCKVTSQNQLNFPDSFLFIPEIVILLTNGELTIGVFNNEGAKIFSEIKSQLLMPQPIPVVHFRQMISRSEYIACVNRLKQHIMQGDCYELNFCQQFYANAVIDPVSVYHALMQTSPNPFSAFYRCDDNYLLCASPERYMKRIGHKILSQPIKGTAARDTSDVANDKMNKNKLANSAKEKAENVMIVDLVRNDLSRVCIRGSVKVEELFGIYSYPHVHQMISTVTGTLPYDASFTDIFKATFPMGSMTGAPKTRVMKLIEETEKGARGIYSGTMGYITPEKDFDFNVVIRSIVYNYTSNKICFHTGSAITANSEAENEYEECFLKGKAIIDVFSSNKKRDA